MKKDYISKARHKIGGLLTTINEGVALLIEDEGDLDKQNRANMLKIVKRNVDRLIIMFGNYFLLQKMEAETLNFEPEAGKLNPIIVKAHGKFKQTASQKGIEIKLELDEKLPSIIFDSNLITVVVENLIANAINFTEKGSVTIASSKVSHYVQISVRDDGVGVEPKNLKDLFEAFEKPLDLRENAPINEGLGLLVSKKIVELHKGKIWAKSTPNKGSTFYFTLPI